MILIFVEESTRSFEEDIAMTDKEEDVEEEQDKDDIVMVEVEDHETALPQPHLDRAEDDDELSIMEISSCECGLCWTSSLAYLSCLQPSQSKVPPKLCRSNPC